MSADFIYLQQITLLTDADEKDPNADTVKLMTIHAAKGLEFSCVFAAGLEEMLFPNAMSINTREELEEERRLFYVVITRAKQKLWITLCQYPLSFWITWCKMNQAVLLMKFRKNIWTEVLPAVVQKPASIPANGSTADLHLTRMNRGFESEIKVKAIVRKTFLSIANNCKDRPTKRTYSFC